MFIQYNQMEPKSYTGTGFTVSRMKADIILPAAGSSERMQLPVAKQYMKVLGKHIIAYTVDCFHRLPWVRHIVVVVSSDQIEFTRQLMEGYGFDRVIVCAGGRTRHRSIHCGVKALKSECTDSDIVIIHDAARPFVTEDIAVKIAEAASLHGAAGVTRPLVSTVIQPDDDQKLKESLDRRIYRNSEMPQAFQYEIIANAYEKCSEDDLEFGTECLLLAMKYSNCRAFLVEGTGDLWKVTYQKDLYSMESVVKEKQMIVSIMGRDGAESQDLYTLWNNLKLKQIKLTSNDHDAANTFVSVFNSQTCPTYGQDLVSTVTNSYAKTPNSAVKLDLFIILIFPSSFLHDRPITNSCMNSQTERTPVSCCHLSENQMQSHQSPFDVGDNLKIGVINSNNDHNSSSGVHKEQQPLLHACGKKDKQLNPLTIKSEIDREAGESSDKDFKILTGDLDHESSVRIVQDLKQRLIAVNGKTSVTTVGIQCKSVQTISEQLTDLVQERSHYLDGQVLSFN